jgi:cytosine/adenosine deaminase-related metal-dependent hydrolase
MTQTVDTLFTNALVLTMDEKLTQYSPGAVAVKGDSIVAVGPEAEIRAEYSAAETFDCGGKVLMPGLVNAHTHVPMTLLRGLADDLRLDVWLMGYMMPVEREFVSPEFVRLGTLLACVEQIRSGVTTFNDMYYFEDAVAQVEKMAATIHKGIVGLPELSAETAVMQDIAALSTSAASLIRDPIDLVDAVTTIFGDIVPALERPLLAY